MPYHPVKKNFISKLNDNYCKSPQKVVTLHQQIGRARARLHSRPPPDELTVNHIYQPFNPTIFHL